MNPVLLPPIVPATVGILVAVVLIATAIDFVRTAWRTRRELKAEEVLLGSAGVLLPVALATVLAGKAALAVPIVVGSTGPLILIAIAITQVVNRRNNRLNRN